MTLSEKLKEIRKRFGLSQEKLAENNECFKTGNNKMGN